MEHRKSGYGREDAKGPTISGTVDFTSLIGIEGDTHWKHKKAPAQNRGFFTFESSLEVVSHTNRGHGNNLISVGLEAIQAEVRRLNHKSAILRTNIEAGA